jgi:hypothetical protein
MHDWSVPVGCSTALHRTPGFVLVGLSIIRARRSVPRLTGIPDVKTAKRREEHPFWTRRKQERQKQRARYARQWLVEIRRGCRKQAGALWKYWA